jgi:hypothetical protein
VMQIPFPPPPDVPDIPPPGPVHTLLLCLAVVLLSAELLLMLLPKEWQRKVNHIRFGPKWQER